MKSVIIIVIIIKVIPIALYFLYFNTNFETNPAERKPPIISIEPATEYYVSTKSKGDIKYGTIKPNPLTVPKKKLNVKKIKIKLLFFNKF